MTVVLGFAVANVALIAADTRLNLSFRSGGTGVKDEGPLDLTYPNGRTLRFGAHFRKIRPSGNNWAGGAGFATVVEEALSAISAESTWPQARAKLESLNPTVIAQTSRDFPGQDAAAISKTAVIYAHYSGGKAALDGYRFDGTSAVPAGAQYALSTPPELPVVAVRAANDRLASELRVPRSLDELFALLRTVSSVFHDVCRHSLSVSDLLEVGMTVHAQPILRMHLLERNQIVMNSSPARIGELFVAL